MFLEFEKKRKIRTLEQCSGLLCSPRLAESIM